MDVEVIYRDGRSREFKPTYLSYETLGAIEAVDTLDLSVLDDGIFLMREYVDMHGNLRSALERAAEGAMACVRPDERKALRIVRRDEFGEVDKVVKNGKVVLVGDGRGNLLDPGELPDEGDEPDADPSAYDLLGREIDAIFGLAE